jgi:hypothetical protein
MLQRQVFLLRLLGTQVVNNFEHAVHKPVGQVEVEQPLRAQFCDCLLRRVFLTHNAIELVFFEHVLDHEGLVVVVADLQSHFEFGPVHEEFLVADGLRPLNELGRLRQVQILKHFEHLQAVKLLLQNVEFLDLIGLLQVLANEELHHVRLHIHVLGVYRDERLSKLGSQVVQQADLDAVGIDFRLGKLDLLYWVHLYCANLLLGDFLFFFQQVVLDQLLDCLQLLVVFLFAFELQIGFVC